MTNDSQTIDGLGPMPLVRPTSVAELGDIVRQASGERPIYPVGGRTLLGFGGVPSTLGTAVDLRGLDRIVDFPARDMTITVECGISLESLRKTLANENLRLPIDVALGESATLGGAIAVNGSGHRRFGYGTLRDYVIGISAVNDEGREFKAGGRVVKNVAGYDICKLLIGSFGTLGVITQATLKLRPLAEERALVAVPCAEGQLAELIDELLSSRTRPVVLEAINRSGCKTLLPEGTCGESKFVVVVGYEGNSDSVKWQMQQLVKELGVRFALEASVGFTSQPLDRALTEWSSWPGSTVTLKASLRSSEVPGFLVEAERWGGEPLLRSHAGNGIVYGHYAGDLSADAARDLVRKWRAAATAVVVQKCPTAWKAALDVWGPPPSDIDAMRAIKARFDPRRIFNPGRFVV